jgi:penicillin-binding protein 1A
LPKAPSAKQPDRQSGAGQASAALHHRSDDGERLHHSRATGCGKKQTLRYRAPCRVAVHAEYVAETCAASSSSRSTCRRVHRGLNVYVTLNSAEQMLAYRLCARASWTTSGGRSTADPRTTSICRATLATSDTRIAEALQDFPDNDELKAAVVTRGQRQEGRRRAGKRPGDPCHRRRVEAGRFRLARREIRRPRSAGSRRPLDPERKGRMGNHSAA